MMIEFYSKIVSIQKRCISPEFKGAQDVKSGEATERVPPEEGASGGECLRKGASERVPPKECPRRRVPFQDGC
jgi:hypothetical protein